MRILFLTQSLPYPLIDGPKIRAYYLLRHLANRHDVTLVSLSCPDDDPDAEEHLRQFCSAVHTVPAPCTRLSLAKVLAGPCCPGIPARHPAMESFLATLARSRAWDAVHAEGLEMAGYALGLRGQLSGRPVLVLDQPHLAHRVAQRRAMNARQPVARLHLELNWRKLATYEALTCGEFDRVLTVTVEDRRVLEHLEEQVRRVKATSAPFERDRYRVVPAGIDAETLSPVERDEHSRLILHIGSLDYGPNVEDVLWFGQRVFPYVRLAVPSARFGVIGSHPPTAVQALRRGSAGRISVTGSVPDPLPYVRQGALMVAPAQLNTGVRVKILNAWAWGVPVVASKAAVSGLDIRPGENILLADDASSFTSAIVQILSNPALARKLSAAGRRWVQNRYDYRRTYSCVDDVYRAEVSLTESEMLVPVGPSVALA